MKVGAPKETYPGERRVAIVPAGVAALKKIGIDVVVQSGAGAAAGYPDRLYAEAGAQVVDDRASAFDGDVVLQVRSLGANPEQGAADLELLREKQWVIGTFDPLGNAEAALQVAQRGVAQFALELVPRITRAQAMDVLSSQANIAGYRAVVLAAARLDKMFPMMMTAAGTISPARAFVIGAGVAGLQAIATAKRLGAVVRAYDVRPAVREQVESLGGKFVEMELETESAEGEGGYAKQMDEDFYARQRELMASVVAESDVVVTTAAIPGKPSPRLITADAVAGMPAGAVIVDLAAERGGNCELSEADQTIERHGVTILGPTNLPAEVPFHASQMYSSNVVNFLKNMVEDGQRRLNPEDEIVRETLITHGGRLVSPRLAEILHQPKPEPPTPHAEELPPEADKPAAEPASEEPKEEPSAEEKAEPEGSGGAGEPSPAETGPAETGPAETGEEKPKPESEGPR